MTPDRAKAVRELLAFYVEAGVDTIVGDEPMNWFADAQASPRPGLARAEDIARPQAGRQQGGHWVPRRDQVALASKSGETGGEAGTYNIAAASVAPPSPEAAVMAARQAAKSAASLDQLRAILERFEGCALRNTATQLVFADGNPQARVMFVGEAPGREEDLAGLPFVGRSGKLLDRMLAAIGLDRTSAYIANIVPWRPPGNRTPTPQEASICLPFTLRQIELCNPDVLVCLGGPSAAALLETRDGITKTRGRWFAFQTGTREIRATATFHPAYLLRTPLSKRLAWRDFLAIKKALAE
jgi:uracil-DNA glycosylase family 4